MMGSKVHQLVVFLRVFIYITIITIKVIQIFMVFPKDKCMPQETRYPFRNYTKKEINNDNEKYNTNK